MQDRPALALYLDTRRAVASKKYPVKIRITWQVIGVNTKYVVKYFGTGEYLSEDEFTVVKAGEARTRELKKSQEAIFKARANAVSIIEKNKRISPEQFIQVYNGKASVTGNVKDLYTEIIAEKKAINKVATAKTYIDAWSSIEKFAGPDLNLSEITQKWLKNYESWFTSQYITVKKKAVRSKSLNTVGFYLRTLRAVFNRAVARNTITTAQYPFGRSGYRIRKVRVKKKAIPAVYKDKLVGYVPENDSEKQALDFALFSYLCNGMNFTDMAYLKTTSFRTDHFVFIRRKTKDTVLEQKEIKIFITPKIREILNRRAIHSPYVFGIITDEMDAETQKLKIHNLIQITNKWLRRIAAKIGYKERISTYAMRHTFVTALINGNVPITKVKDALGHMSVLTTQEYAEDLDLDTSKTFGSLL